MSFVSKMFALVWLVALVVGVRTAVAQPPAPPFPPVAAPEPSRDATVPGPELRWALAPAARRATGRELPGIELRGLVADGKGVLRASVAVDRQTYILREGREIFVPGFRTDSGLEHVKKTTSVMGAHTEHQEAHSPISGPQVGVLRIRAKVVTYEEVEVEVQQLPAGEPMTITLK